MSYRPVSAGHRASDLPFDVQQGNFEALVEEVAAYLDKRLFYLSRISRQPKVASITAGYLATRPQLLQHRRRYLLADVITELWNKHCLENTIMYPFDTPWFNGLGKDLGKHKTLIIQGNTGGCTGVGARGTIVHLGKSGALAGYGATGPVIIAGECGHFAAADAKGPVIIAGKTGDNAGCRAKGPIIALRQAHIDSAFKGTLVGPEEYEKNVGLKTYVDRLLELAKEDPVEIETVFGNGNTITRSINELIGGRS